MRFRRTINGLLTGLMLGASHCVSSQDVTTGFTMVQAAREQIRNVNTEELRELLAKHPDLVLIDVRMADEIASLGGRIDAGFRTYNINRGWLEFRTEALIPDKSTPVVVYCGINQRSPLAARTLGEMGYTNVFNYADGFFKWKEAELPTRQLDLSLIHI